MDWNCKISSSPIRLRYRVLMVVAFWTIAVGASLVWNIRQEYQNAIEAARVESLAAYNKDLVHRRWTAMHGGVYVPVTEDTPPNPYLSHIEERDITTPSGRSLTLVNPAYMTRQVYELAAEQYGVRGHITSLKPIRSENAPDPWERAALQAFENGASEIFEVTDIDGHKFMRIMWPMFTEERCLKCHAAQGYKVGDIRGGISVSTPLKPHMDIARAAMVSLSMGHGFLWVVGLIGFHLGNWRIKLQRQIRILAEEKREEALYNIGERIKELSCMYGVAESIRKRSKLSEVFSDVIKLIPPGWQYPEITRGRICYDNEEYVDEPFEPTPWKQTCNIVVSGEKHGSIEVYYLQERPVIDEGPFLKEERHLIEGISKALSEAIERKNAEFERNQLVRTLSLKNEELESIMYTTTHDLRSPLVNIQGFSGELNQSCTQLEQLVPESHLPETVQQELLTILKSDIPASLKFINAGVQRMNTLQNGLLKLCRLGSAEFTGEHLDINTIVSDVVAAMQYQIDQSGVAVTVDDLPDCFGDENQISQVFTNLLDNAIKFLDPTRKGLIHISAAMDQGNSIYCVQDNGIGIAPDHTGKVFEIFHRLDPQAYETGEGLGLTVVKRIVDRHSGQIWLESEPGTGSKFFIALPAACPVNSHTMSDTGVIDACWK